MGLLISRNLRLESYMNAYGEQIHNVDVQLHINRERYKIVACIQNDEEICLKGIRSRVFRIKYSDIIAPEVISGIWNNSKPRLVLTAYPTVGKKRHLVKVIFTFIDDDIMIHVRDGIVKRIVTSKAPHLLPTVNHTNRRILVIVNPFSGRKRAPKLWKSYVAPIFQIAKIDYDIIRTDHERHAVDIARNLKLDKYDAIAVISGDGLILEVISGFLSRLDRERALKMPIAHIPGGTSNGLAASICFQCNETFPPRGVFCTEMASMIVRPRYLPLRISHVQTERDGDRAMFMSITWGLIADIDIGSERFRWAGMARLHIEAFLRIAKLPKVAHYKAKVSYLPVNHDAKSAAKLRRGLKREEYSEGHFDYAPVKNFMDCKHSEPGSPSDIFKDADLVQVPALFEPVGSDWMVLEGFFIYVCLTSLSHIGSDAPYLPCARLDDEFLYLTYVDWKNIKSRFEVARLLLGIDDCSHLTCPFLQIIPVRACRVEPLDGCGGYVAVDGEQITSGSAFQAVPSKYCATVIGRNERR